MFFQRQNWRKLPNLTEISFHQMKQRVRDDIIGVKVRKVCDAINKGGLKNKNQCMPYQSLSLILKFTYHRPYRPTSYQMCVSNQTVQQNAPSPFFFFWVVVVLTSWVRELSLQNPHKERDQPGNTTHLKCPPKTAQHSIRERSRPSYTAKRHFKFYVWNTFNYWAFEMSSAQISPTASTQKHSTDCPTERLQRQNTAVNVQHLNSDMFLP